MRRAVTGFWVSAGDRLAPAQAAVCCSFLLGSLLGMMLALSITGGDELLAHYLEQLLHAAAAGSLAPPSVWQSLCGCLGWYLAVILIGATPVGLPGISLVFLLRGLFLSFSVTSFARASDSLGLEVAFLLLGLPALLSVPPLLLLGTRCFAAGWSGLGRREQGIPWSCPLLLCAAVCGAVGLLSVLLEIKFCPLLLAGLSRTHLSIGS